MIRQLMAVIVGVSLVGCSAIELNQQNEQATQQTEANIAGTVESQINQERAEITATVEILSANMQETANAIDTQSAIAAAEDSALATQIADATQNADQISTQIFETAIADLSRTPEPDSESTAEVTADATDDTFPTDADIVVYGSVPVDSDSLNSITAMTFDSDGHLLVSLRAGEIYRLEDTDDDGLADETQLIFEDTDNDIGQVSGLFVEGDILYVINSEQLSQLQDTDDDGDYETIIHLSDDLPQNQALLQANNSLVRSVDGRYFTADVNTGEILQITLTD